MVLITSAALTAKAVVWPTGQASEDGHRRSLMAFHNE